ncbi:GtrA family protein [Candidatus Saccharibacteria bacterium]|nr:GtrA family protein [Candidatus Saccharibacteria bacterium]
MWQEFLRHKRIVQFVEYMIGGGVFFWSGMAVFALLYSVIKIDWLIAKLIADAVGWTLSFFIQRYWAFNDPRLKHKTLQTGKRYTLITVANFAIDYAIVATMKHFGVTPYLGMITASIFFTVWNYLWYRFWVFDPES